MSVVWVMNNGKGGRNMVRQDNDEDSYWLFGNDREFTWSELEALGYSKIRKLNTGEVMDFIVECGLQQ